MTLQDFAFYINRQLKLHPNDADAEVVILNNIPHVGPPVTVEVTGVRVGNDWERGFCILTTKEKMVVKK
jgi:hypothetical protein